PFLALSYGDVDADGRMEILSGSFESDSGYGGGLYFVHDALTHEQEYQSGPVTYWKKLWRIRNANVDADPQQEIFTAVAETITCYDGISHTEQWSAMVGDSSVSAASMAIADVDADGQLEVVAG